VDSARHVLFVPDTASLAKRAKNTPT